MQQCTLNSRWLSDWLPGVLQLNGKHVSGEHLFAIRKCTRDVIYIGVTALPRCLGKLIQFCQLSTFFDGNTLGSTTFRIHTNDRPIRSTLALDMHSRGLCSVFKQHAKTFDANGPIKLDKTLYKPKHAAGYRIYSLFTQLFQTGSFYVYDTVYFSFSTFHLYFPYSIPPTPPLSIPICLPFPSICLFCSILILFRG